MENSIPFTVSQGGFSLANYNDNVKVLQILDLLKNLDRYLDCSYDEYDHSAQFSIFRSGTLENSFTLFVTTVYPIDIA